MNLTDEQMSVLKKAIYQQWRYPKAQPKPDSDQDRWERVPRVQMAYLDGLINALLAVAVGVEPTVRHLGAATQGREVRELHWQLLDEVKAEHGWADTNPDWRTEEESI